MKNYHLHNLTATIFTSQFPSFSDKDFFNHLVNSNLFSYFIFQRELTFEGKEHWQFYGELSKREYFSKLQKLFHSSHLERRIGSQTEAINYCKKEKSRVGKTYEWGRKKVNTYSRSSFSPEKNNSLLEKTIKEIEKRKFSDFRQLSFKNKSFFWKNRNLLKDIWNEYHPINQLDIFPARVIWLFGESGAGKSIWTRKYLKENDYSNKDIASISPQNMTYSNKIYFDLSHENCKVLVINEVDENFPKHNNLIAFIDRNVLLATKGSYIRNNFELIIVNSIYRPETIFSFLGKEIASQIIRRIWDPLVKCLVYHVIKNEKKISDWKKDFLNEDFQVFYQPILLPIIDPDYSLIPKNLEDTRHTD